MYNNYRYPSDLIDADMYGFSFISRKQEFRMSLATHVQFYFYCAKNSNSI